MTWKEVYFYLRGLCTGVGYIYNECETACIIPVEKNPPSWKKGYIIICNARRASYRTLALELGHELGHALRLVPNVEDRIVTESREELSDEVEAMNFIVAIIKKLGLKLSKRDEQEIDKYTSLCKEYDKLCLKQKMRQIGERIKRMKGEEE